MKRLISLLCLSLAPVLAGLVAGCGAVSDPPAAVVNGEEITEAELREELDAIRENEEYVQLLQQPGDPTQAPLQVLGRGDGTIDSEFVARVLGRQILLELIHQEFERRDLELTDAELKTASEQIEAELGKELVDAFPKGYRETIARRNAEVAKLQQDLADVEVDDAAIEAFYEENRSRYELDCASHILVETREEAAEIKAEIDGGASFEELARERSTDTNSGAQGGSLDCQPVGTFVPEFTQALAAATPGVVTDPVETQFGFHLILLRERQVQPLDEVAGQIRQELLSAAQGEFAQFVTEAAQEAEVEVNKRYGTYDKEAGPTGAVIPPTSPSTSRQPSTTAPGDIPFEE